MEQQPQQVKLNQLPAYKRVIAENKRLKEKIAELEKQLKALCDFIGIGDKK